MKNKRLILDMKMEYRLGLTCIRCERLLELSLFEEDSDMCTECANKKQKYDLSFLESYCRVKEVQLTEEYKSVTRETRISGICVLCKGNFSKTLRRLVESRALCKKCTTNIMRIKTKKTCLEKYGVEYSLRAREVKEKGRNTCIKKYGVEHPSQSEEIKQKIKETCLEKYGVENPLQSEEIKQKIKETCLEKYGAEHPLQSEEIKQKVKDTCMEKYGVKCPLQVEEIKNKIKETCLEKYGVENPLQSEEIKQKVKDTCLEKYGVEHPSQSEEIKQKMKNTCLEKYGAEHPLQSEEIKQKVKDTCMEKYGVKCSLQVEEIKSKIKETFLEKYGVINPSQSENIKMKKIETSIKNYGVPNPMQNPEIASKCLSSSFRMKDYTFPSGFIIQIQGYEYFALDELVKIGYTETDIITGTKNVPRIWYEDSEEVKHVHYPDIWIPAENRLIEVKSTWTFGRKKDNVIEKQKTAQEFGYKYEIWVYNSKGEKDIVE